LQQTFSFNDQKIQRRIGCGQAARETFVASLADDGLEPESAWWQSLLRGSRVEGPPPTGRITVVDAFCGSGGLALGASYAAEALHRTIDFAGIIDTDAEALKVHQHNFGSRRALSQSLTRLVDYAVRGAGEEASFGYAPEVINADLLRHPSVDLLIAGPPCQGHSNLNNHTRRQDPRNDLYVTTAALAVALKAKTVLIENVPTVQNSNADVVATAIALLKNAGYGVSTGVLRADELGAPQRRSRFFIFAVADHEIGADTLISFSRKFVCPPQTASWAISDLADFCGASIWDKAPEPTPVNRSRIDYLFDHDLFDLPDAERPDCHKGGTTYTAVYGRMHPDRPAQTITTGFGTPGQGRYIHPTRRRLITPHEAARLQGFPDWFDFSPPGLPPKRKNLAKWIGDAVHPILGYVSGLLALEMLEQRAGALQRAA
jgi:DNA (cytosine-5)-methyltransferase 1